MHDAYIILKEYLYQINPNLVVEDRLEELYTGKNMVCIKHQFIPDNKYTQLTVLINQDKDNKELASFILSVEATRSRLAPRPQVIQSKMVNGQEKEVLVTYLVHIDILSDDIIGLEQESGIYVTPHQLTLNVNITKIKEEFYE